MDYRGGIYSGYGCEMASTLCRYVLRKGIYLFLIGCDACDGKESLRSC